MFSLSLHTFKLGDNLFFPVYKDQPADRLFIQWESIMCKFFFKILNTLMLIIHLLFL